LRTATDLLAKLERDLVRLQVNPMDSYAAFDFFVTAYHILDWVYPGNVNQQKRQDIENDELLLQIASHLANGSKHFELNDRRHKSVEDVIRHEGGFDLEAFDPEAFDTDELLVLLKGDAAAQFGSSVSAIELAKKMVEYWKQRCLFES
jgi:hypothetical protein